MPRVPRLERDDELIGHIYASTTVRRGRRQVYRVLGRLSDQAIWLFERLDDNAQGQRGTIKRGNRLFLGGLERID